MPTVTNTIKLPDGTAPTTATVIIDLVASESVNASAAAWITATDVTVLATSRPTVTAGAWSASLTANSGIDPAGTVYRVREWVGNRRYTHYISVGAGGGSVHDLLVSGPAGVMFDNVATHAALTAAHGATGAVVGTTNTQTLTNKTLSSPTITTPTISGGLAVAQGGTGATTEATARVSLSVQREFELDARDYGLSTGASQAANATALQAAFDDAAAGQTLVIPDGTYAYNATPTLSASLNIRGEGPYTTILLPVGCDGIQVAAGVSNSSIRNIEFATTRYTSTPNTLVGLEILGSTGSRPFNWVIEDVYFDGFQTGIVTNWLWASEFRNVRTNYGPNGIEVLGSSVNNRVAGGQYNGADIVGGIGINLNGTATAGEGWIIDGAVIDSFGRAVNVISTVHTKIVNCILDHCLEYGVYLGDNGVNMAGNLEVAFNWVGMAAGSTAGICNNNTIANASFLNGNTFEGNRIWAYSSGGMQYGIQLTHANSGPDEIAGNTIFRSSDADIYCPLSTRARIHDNRCLTASPSVANIVGGGYDHDNFGSRLVDDSNRVVSSIANKKFTWGDTAPTTGTWAIGDTCWHRTPTAGGTMGWVCTAAGTPGTWKTFGAISA